MYGKLYENDKDHGLSSNYIYCNVCNSLVFISENGHSDNYNHLKTENSILNEYARRQEIFQSIVRREFRIWQYKQYILQEKANINYLYLKLFTQSISHSKKDKLA